MLRDIQTVSERRFAHQLCAVSFVLSTLALVCAVIVLITHSTPNEKTNKAASVSRFSRIEIVNDEGKVVAVLDKGGLSLASGARVKILNPGNSVAEDLSFGGLTLDLGSAINFIDNDGSNVMTLSASGVTMSEGGPYQRSLRLRSGLVMIETGKPANEIVIDSDTATVRVCGDTVNHAVLGNDTGVCFAGQIK